MSNLTTVAGGCHCGAVRYEAEVDLGKTMACNCSHCQAKGMILTFTPADRFRQVAGEDRLAEYRFNHRVIAHRFCSGCGVEAFALGTLPDGTEVAAVNVRTIDGIDLDSLTPEPFDGRNM